MVDLASGNFCLKGHIDVPTDQREAIADALKLHVELTRIETGCIYFNVEPCSEVSGRYLVSEAFIDKAAFDFHQKRAGASNWAIVSKDVPRHYETWVVE